jgi:predicted nucleic acid-binding protein
VTAYLLDTCVIIDYLRDRHEAVQFMRQQGIRPAVSAITAAELFAGVRNSAEEHQIEALCGRLLIHQVDLEIARLGGSYCRQYRHTHGVQIADALIAATARIHEARLVTRNARHFPMLDDLIVPYRLN